MKFLAVLLLFSGWISTIYADADADDCQWSDCHGLTTPGQLMCDMKDIGTYIREMSNATREIRNAGCGWDSSRVKCCRPPNYEKKPKVDTPPVPIMYVWATDCQWSDCHTPAGNGQFICDLNGLGNYTEGKLSNATTDGCDLNMSRVECCQTFQTDCQWSDCYGLTTPGQLMCDLKRPGLSYTIQYSPTTTLSNPSGGGCALWNSRVACCPSNSGGKLESAVYVLLLLGLCVIVMFFSTVLPNRK